MCGKKRQVNVGGGEEICTRMGDLRVNMSERRGGGKKRKGVRGIVLLRVSGYVWEGAEGKGVGGAWSHISH